MSLSNADFKLLCESLGFYTPESILDYFQNLNIHETLKKRPVQYWFNGKLAAEVEIPSYITDIFLSLENQKIIFSQQEIFIKNNFLFKEKELMWKYFPCLKGLPCSYLNQLMILINMLHGQRKMKYYYGQY